MDNNFSIGISNSGSVESHREETVDKQEIQTSRQRQTQMVRSRYKKKNNNIYCNCVVEYMVGFGNDYGSRQRNEKAQIFNEKASLERRLEDMDNLQAEYAELETECKEVKNKLENERYDRLAYEIITIDAVDKERDFTTVFYDIARRENFSVWEELFVSQRITSIASKLSEYEK